jgi:broad specificity phosphatase PhoE
VGSGDGLTYPEIADRLGTIAAEHDDGEHVLAVTHGDVMAAVDARATGADPARFFAAKAEDELDDGLREKRPPA